MTKKPLVSIIIPCYNGHDTLNMCFDSVLAQTYKNLEIITVNDGSTDDTEEIILSYTSKFSEAGMIHKHISQENAGIGGAINAGLKEFTGDYLCWIDKDDFMMPQSVELKLNFLEEHPEFGSVTSNGYMYNSDDLSNPIGKVAPDKYDNENPEQFLLLLRSQSVFCSGCHMVRASAFLDVNPERHIYPCRRGQNWQLLLPVYYKYKRAFIDVPLYGYIIYQTSMSRGDDTKEKKIFRFNEHLDIITNTLAAIKMSDRERKKYMKVYRGLYYRQMYGTYALSKDYKNALKYLWKMFLSGEFNVRDISQIFRTVFCKGSKAKSKK